MATAHYTRFDSRSTSFQQLSKCTAAQSKLFISAYRKAQPTIPLAWEEAKRHDAWARIQPASRILKEEKPYTGVIYHAAREV